MYKLILAAVDASNYAGLVLEAAVELAEKFDGRVHLYRCIELPREFPAAAANQPDLLPAYLQAEVLGALQLLARGHPRVIVEAPAMQRGPAWRTVLGHAELVKPDLLVIGSHGFDGWDRVLGTNAGAIANRSRFSVLVVHPPAPH